RRRGLTINQVRAGGGGARSAWWRQLMADVFEAEVVTVNTSEGAAYGAALLAAVGAGAFDSVPAACGACVRITSRMRPDRRHVAAYSEMRPRFARLYAALRSERETSEAE